MIFPLSKVGTYIISWVGTYLNTRKNHAATKIINGYVYRLLTKIVLFPTGRLANGYGSFIPLKGTYELYRSLGEPHTVRTFLCAVRRPPHCLDEPETTLIDAPDDALPIGRNVYIFGDEIFFIAGRLLVDLS